MSKEINATVTAYALVKCYGDKANCSYKECPFKGENCVRMLHCTAAGHIGAASLHNIFCDDDAEMEDENDKH